MSELKDLIADVREQVLFLQELGVDALAVELSDAVNSESRGTASPHPVSAKPLKEAPPEISIPKRDPASTPRQAGSRLAALPSLKSRSKPPKIQAAVPNDVTQAPQVKSFEEDRSLIDVSPKLEETTDTIETIRAEIGNCLRCPLHEGRTQVVHTTGNFDSDLMFVGEAPGADEDAQGFPFVGRAGQLLTKIIEGIGYKREEVAIGNINRCRPPGNRTPTLVEAHTCRPFLLREVAVIRPKVIVVLGNTALHNLLDTKVGITKVRGQFQDYFGVKVMPTFHPAYLLRDPHKKREVWEDMKKVRDYLAQARA